MVYAPIWMRGDEGETIDYPRAISNLKIVFDICSRYALDCFCDASGIGADVSQRFRYRPYARTRSK